MSKKPRIWKSIGYWGYPRGWLVRGETPGLGGLISDIVGIQLTLFLDFLRYQFHQLILMMTFLFSGSSFFQSNEVNHVL